MRRGMTSIFFFLSLFMAEISGPRAAGTAVDRGQLSARRSSARCRRERCIERLEMVIYVS